MALDVQLSDFMPDVVTIAPYGSVNDYGEVTTGTTRTARAYVEPDTGFNQGDQIDEQHHPMRAYIADTAIGIKDRITLPNGSTPDISNVAVHTPVDGLEHTIVTFS